MEREKQSHFNHRLHEDDINSPTFPAQLKVTSLKDLIECTSINVM